MARTILAVLAVTLAAAACGGRANLGGLSPEALFERGMEAYRAEEWSEAVRVFDRLTLEYPTHPRIQEARFRLGESYFGREEYVMAAGEFTRLASDYPTGEFADDSRFKVCESYYEMSPEVQLDQEYTRAAIDHCRSLLAYYPGSEFVPRAQAMVQELEEKLAAKVLVGGDFYFKRGAYDSAVIYYEDVLARYPQSSAAPKALLKLVQAYQAIGYLDEAEEARDRLLRDFPTSAEAEQAREISLASGA